MLHLLQINSFKFDNIQLETNYHYKRKKGTENPFLNDTLDLSFAILDMAKSNRHKRLIIYLKLNNTEESFKKSPYKVILTAGLEVMVPPDTPADVMYKAIKLSGFHLLITNVRAYLADFTSSCYWGEIILPTLDLTDLSNEIDKLIELKLNESKSE